MFTFFKNKLRKPTAYNAIKDLGRIDSINDYKKFKEEFAAYLRRSELKKVNKVNHAYTSHLFSCIRRLVDGNEVEFIASLKKRIQSLPNCLHILIWIDMSALGIAGIPRPFLKGSSKEVVLGVRVLIQHVSDRQIIDRIYDEVRSDLDVSAFSVDELGAFLSFLLAIKRYDDFIFYLESQGVNSYQNPGHLRNVAHVYLYMGAYDKLARIKKEARNLLDEVAHLGFLISLKAAALNQDDGYFLLEGLGKQLIPQSNVYDVVHLLYKKGFSYSELRDFIPPESLTDFQQLRVHEMALEAEQEKLLAMSEIEPVEMQRFVGITRSLKGGYDGRFVNRSEDEIRLYNGICQLEDNARAAFLHTESSFDQSLGLVNEIKDRIKRKIPTSFVRIGDGEALFMRMPGQELLDSDEKSLKRIVTTWWGAEFKPGKEDYLALTEIIDQSVTDADIIGVVPKWRIFDNQSYAADSAKDHRDAFLRMLVYLNGASEKFVSDRIVTSCHAHQSLIRWDLYRELFRGLESVSVISCHDLRNNLLQQFGLKVRGQYVTPPEHAYSARFSGESISEPMYPDGMRRIVGELDVQPGEVFLVAAGFVGKYFCSRIKEMGGIALDIGSAADYLMGHQTRVFSHNEIEFEPRHYLIPGSGLDSYQLEKSGRSDVNEYVATDSRSHRDITVDSRPQITKGQASDAYRFYKVQLIGHPRCASGYVAGVLSNCGIRLGHEKLSRDGICSWMHTVKDCHVPWGDSPHPDLHFEKTLAYARSPLKSIPSIALENCKARSFSFRRYHIFDLEGVDIAGFGTSIERAIASYVYWYRIVLRNEPAGLVRVEYLEEDLIALLPQFRSIGFDINEGDVVEARQGHIRSNDSAYKFEFEKPSYSKRDWDQVDDKLLYELDRVSRQLGYKGIDSFD